MNDFDYYEDTNVDKTPKSKFTFVGLFKDIMTLFIFVFVIYALYIGGTVGYYHWKMGSKISEFSYYASVSSDDSRIKSVLKDYCLSEDKITCMGDSLKIDRNFKSSTVSIKYNFNIDLFWKYPITLTFEPKSTKEIVSLEL